MGDHTSITNEHEAVEPEPLVQVADGLLHGAMVHLVAGPDVMRDGPACHHHDADDYLDIVRFAIPAVAVFGEIGRSGTFTGGAGDVREHQVRLEAKQVAAAVIKSNLDLFLGGHELIEGSVPGFQLAEVDADPLVLVPFGKEPSPPAVADEVGLQPAGQAVFAGGMDQAIGDQNKDPVGKRHAFGVAQCGVQDGPQSQLIEEGTNGEDRSPGGGSDDVQIFGLVSLGGGVLAEQALKLGQHFRQEILAPRSATVRCLTLPLSR